MRWINTPHTTDHSLNGLHPLVEQTLLKHGIQTPAAAQAFLEADAYAPTPASALPGMDAACERISSAIRAGERICIWGDFDVDGQTATSILVETLSALGANVTYHIPVRATESHGVNIPHLKEVIDQGAQLVVTCDTGITAHESVDYARTRGVDMVITDHHDLGDTLPKAVAVTDPKLLAPDHPLANLPGAGVAYKLAETLLQNSASSIRPADLLDLVALGTVADLAILRGDTRFLVQKGLDALRHTQRLGLKTMMELAELRPENLSESHIGFALGPRLNALGRLGDANPAVDLLTTQDPIRARVLATHLEGLNIQRKLLCDQVTLAAEAQLRADPSLLAQPIIILAHAEWPGGVVGIVAARLVERYGKPAILMTIGADGIVRGSARSVEGLHITEAIAAQKDILRNFGGHPMAAGLGLETTKLGEFRKRMSKTVGQMLAEAHVEKAALQIDGWINLPEITLDLAGQIEKLAPFGPGNERLVLATPNLAVKSTSTVGKSAEHVRLIVEDEAGNSQPVLWWNGGTEEMPTGRFDLAYSIRTSDYKGQKQVTVEFVDFRVGEGASIEVSTKLEIEDLRSLDKKDERGKTILSSFVFPYAIWAEGEHKKALEGLGRHELTPAETLVIWTVPPSPETLREALEKVQPRRVVLVGVNPNGIEVKSFLERLAGLVKFVLNKREGRVTLVELASATGARLAAVRLGLEYLSKRGQVTVESESAGEVLLAASNAGADDSALAGIESQLRIILRETAAYRSYFAKALNPLEAE